MFGWDLYKSAEAMFSRWAIKRLLKFLLKKRLADYILGDIDLDQLDVQLRQGIIQLSDLALNVDFLNGMLGSAPIIVKEGSIASLSVRVPLNMKDWQIEVEELELVLAPHVFYRSSAAFGNEHIKNDHDVTVGSPQKLEQIREEGSSCSASLNVHEGVKTIAKIVQLFLTSFRVTLKKLIIAFDPGSEAAEKKPDLCRILVLRIAETEFGTCISEAMVPFCGPSILGISKLTNFIKFQGALVEFLEINRIDNKKQNPCSLGMSFNEFYSENSLPSGFTAKILGGPTGGFSGVLDLSIPWKNGCLDINKLRAEIAIDPVHLILLPSTIMWIISLEGYLKDVMNDDVSPTHIPTDPSYFKHKSHGNSDGEDSSLLPREVMMSGTGTYSSSTDSPLCQDILSDALLLGPRVIHNWIPLSVDPDDNYEVQPDYAASIDQFFECFDGMRSSQASLGNSGMWNLACSVFSAITAASSLASGCEHIPSEQQNIETNLKATVAAISIALSFHDEMKDSSQPIGIHQQMDDMCGTQYKSFTSVGLVGSSFYGEGFESCMSNLPFVDTVQSSEEDLGRHDMHLLNILCFNLTFTFQIFPQCTKFGATMQHIKVDDHFLEGQALRGIGHHCINDFPSQTHPVNHLQAGVQSALPPFSSVSKVSKEAGVMQSADDNLCADIFKIPPFDESFKVTLFESFGECSGEYFANCTNLSDKTVASTSFSVKFPPFIFWLDIHLVNLMIDFCKQTGNSFETGNSKEDTNCDVRAEIPNLSTNRDVENTKQIKLVPSKNLQGNIQLPTARIILCLNLDGSRHSFQVFQWDTFIGLDFSGAISEKVHDGSRIPIRNSCRSHTNSDYTSICLDGGSIDVYLVTIASKNDMGTGYTGGQLYSASKILSAIHQLNNHHSTVSLFWQKGPVTNPLMARRVWDLAASKDPTSRNNIPGIGGEFASVTTPDAEEANSQVRQELIHSSAFLLHIHFPLVSANLAHHEYEQLHHIVNKILNLLSYDANNDAAIGTRSESNGTTAAGNNTQASILLEFDFLDLCITSDVVGETSKFLQRELSGSWTSLLLKLEKFELLSVSNIGGFRDAGFFWISHGEGDLWGSVSCMNERPSTASHKFLLITCRNSTLRRGDGGGGNAISFGPAGTFIMHLKNPQAYTSFTSVIVRCGTIIAPGCRLDWFNEIILFFWPSCCHEEAGDDHSLNKISNDDVNYKTSFLLDLVDVALSYEPHIVGGGVSGSNCSSYDVNKGSSQNYVACILAASSFNIHQIAEDVPNDDYNIRLHDLGLLICQWPGSNSSKIYDVDHLRKTGYVKIAGDAIVAGVVRTKCENNLLWEVEFSGLHVKMNTCSDTTMGLVSLLGQFQQLFAPDIEDSLVHLQSRWSSTQSKHESDKLNTNETSELVNDIEPQMGLMDEVVDDIFFYQADEIMQSNSCDFQNGFLGGKHDARDSTELNISCSNDNISCISVPSVGSRQGIVQEISQPSCVDRICFPDIMESYYVTELLPREKHSLGSHSDEAPEFQADTSHIAVGEKSGWYKNNSLVIVENHVSVVTDHHLEKQLIKHNDDSTLQPFPTGTCKPTGRIMLKNTEMRWRMSGGTDWPDARKKTSELKSAVRDQGACLELQLFGVNLLHDVYPDGELIVSNLSLSLQEIFLYDNSLNAPWKMVLGHYHSKEHPRESCAKVLKLDLESVRPDPAIPLEEYRLQLAILPMRLHLDQSQLDFLVSFFTGVSVLESSDMANDLNRQGHPEEDNYSHKTVPKEALLPFFQKCDIWPVVVRVDYIPRHIDLAALRGGNYIELINLVPWKGIELQLKHVHAVGIYGWGGICEAVAEDWLEDISKNQVHKLLKGLKPISSLFSVSSGAAKLVSLPVKDYKKEHRLVKGMQRGAVSFLRSISVEAVGLGVHLAAGVHDILLKTECALAGSPQLLAASGGKKAGSNSIRSNQPKDVHQGMQQACESLGDGFSKTASALVGKPLKTYQRGAGAGLALVSAIRAAPAAAVAPASSAARAVHCALLGVRNSLDPEHEKDSMEKYHGSSRHQDYEK